MEPRHTLERRDTTNLADILDRILDKGIVIAGDISINLVDIELITIKLRLLIASADKARELGINWWETDPWLSARRNGQSETHALEERLERIETVLERLPVRHD
jgi:Gas vesicle protein